MNNKFWILFICGVLLILSWVLYLRAPLIGGRLTKQTIYLWFLDSWRGKTASNPKAQILLVDDDSEDGIFKIKKICDELGVKAAFAVIPSRINSVLGDSLLKWQNEGYGICLHGYNHDQWKDWTYDAVVEDIHKSNVTLKQLGFCTENIKYIVPPHSCNTGNIRQAVEDEGYQMICGASIINPDTEPFLLGRVFIDKYTDLKKIQSLLEKAKKRESFVILGTHSSNSNEFSEEKTKAILTMAKDIGFEYYY